MAIARCGGDNATIFTVNKLTSGGCHSAWNHYSFTIEGEYEKIDATDATMKYIQRAKPETVGKISVDFGKRWWPRRYFQDRMLSIRKWKTN